MILANPWALSGLALAAVPLIIHLIGRHRARVLKFPSLRFLAASRLTPTRRTRPSDLALLVVRLAIVVAAVVAMSQPRFETPTRIAAREQTFGRLRARAIIVDTSMSMRRLVPGGESALAVARRQAKGFAADATTSEVIETFAPAHVLAGASQWLGGQSGKREMIILSDFQVGTVDSTALAAIAPEIGIRLARIDASQPRGAMEARTGDRVARIIFDADTLAARVEWSPATRATNAGPTLFADAGELVRAGAAKNAAMILGAITTPDSGRPIAIVYVKYDRRADLVRVAKAIDQPWMGDAVARLHADAGLVSAAATANVAADASVVGAQFAVVVRNDRLQPVVVASAGEIGNSNGLQLWMLTDAGSVTSAALFAGLAHATDRAAPIEELQPRTLSPDVLSRWERMPGSAAPRPDQNGESDGGWFWLLALLLLALESHVRRGPGLGPLPRVEGRPDDDTGSDNGDPGRRRHVA